MNRNTTISICLVLLISAFPAIAQKGGEPDSTENYGFHDGLSPYFDAKSFTWGYINKTGGISIPVRFAETTPFSDGVALVATGGVVDELAWFVIDKAGKTVFECKKLSIQGRFIFSEGLALVAIETDSEETVVFIDTRGNVVLKPEVKVIGNFTNDRALFEIQDDAGNTKYGYIDKKGKVVIPAIYDSAHSLSEGMAYTKIYDDISGEKCAFIDAAGKKLFDAQPFDVSDYSDGLSLIWTDEAPKKMKFLDKKGKEVLTIAKQYSGVNVFFDGLARVSLWSDEDGMNNYGYIDKTGKEVIKPQYANSGDFSEDLAPVRVKDKVGFIDKKGKLAIKATFDPAWGG